MAASCGLDGEMSGTTSGGTCTDQLIEFIFVQDTSVLLNN